MKKPTARVFYISLVFSNARRVLSQCNTRLRLLYFPGEGGEGTPIWNRRECSSEILNLTPTGDHLGVAKALRDP